MRENTSVPAEKSETAKHLITRRKLLKQAGAAGIAMTALYVAPSFSSFGPKRAYASQTGIPCSSDLCVGDRKPNQLTMIYTGDSGNGSNSQTGTKSPVISGSMSGQSLVTIKWVKKDDISTVYQTFSNVPVDGPIVLNAGVDGHNDSDGHLHHETRLIICYPTGTAVQDIKFHTSCSAPLFIGDTFGGLELGQFVDEDGNVDCNPSTPDTEEGDCPTSGKKIQTLSLLYQGKNDTNSSHTQDPTKVEIDDYNGGPTGATVYIEVCDDLTSPSNIWFAGDVGLNSTFVATAGGGTSKLTNETFVKVYASNGGDLLQEIEFHTSCSQPLVVGNEFGSITINGLGLVDK
jgi:hypothetical protein